MGQSVAGGVMAWQREGNQRNVKVTARVSLPKLVAYIFCLFAVALFFVWSNAQVVRASYELGDLRKAEERLVKQNQDLKVEIATYRAPATLSRVASEKLGMVPAAPDQVVMVK